MSVYAKLSDFSPLGGGANDTTAFNDLLNSGAPWLWIDEGDWYVDLLDVPASVRKITGPGRIHQRQLNTNLFRVQAKENIVFDGLTLVGAGTVGMTTSQSGNTAIWIEAGSKNIRVVNCDISLFSHFAAFAEGSEEIYFEGNRAKHTGYGFRLRGVNKFRITDNLIEDTIFPESMFVVAIGIDSVVGHTYGICKRGYIQRNMITGFVNAQSIMVHAGNDVWVSDNLCDGSVIGIGVVASRSSVTFGDGDEINRQQIVGNIIKCPGSVNHTTSGNDGINVMGGLSQDGGMCPDPRDVVVALNQIHNANRAEQHVKMGGIRVARTMRSTLVGNHIQGAQGNGVVAETNNVELMLRSQRHSQVIPIGSVKNSLLVTPSGTMTGSETDTWFT